MTPFGWVVLVSVALFVAVVIPSFAWWRRVHPLAPTPKTPPGPIEPWFPDT